MKGINRTVTAGMVAGMLALTPVLATASGDNSPSNTRFHALSTLQQADIMTLDAMSENELNGIQGEFFNFGLNFAFAPQINICIFCTGVTQSNLAMIFGFNSFP